MNLSVPAWRTPFHPAWLLLLLPMAATLFAELYFDSLVVNAFWFVRLGVVSVILLPLILTRNAHLSGVGYRLLKEFRLQLPGCAVAFLGPGFIGLSGFETRSSPDMAFVATLPFLFGGVLMLASAFGREFEQGTLSGLLAQPVSRGQLFVEKLVVPVFLTLMAALNLFLILCEHTDSTRLFSMVLEGLPLVTMILISAPYFSLVSKGTLPAVVFSLVVPHIFGLIRMNLEELSRRFWPSDIWYQRGFGPISTGLGTLVYGLALGWLAWRCLDRLELNQEGARGRSISGVNKVVAPLDGLLARLLPARSGFGQLVRKELRLHVIPWLAVVLQLILSVLVAAMRWFSEGSADLQMMTGGPGLMGLVLLLAVIGLIGAGAAVVAEERELGTLDWQLTQPVALRAQWTAKLGVAALTAFVAAVFFPYLSLALGLGWARFSQVLVDIQPEEWLMHGALWCGLFAASVYASSSCRSTVAAMLATVVVGTGLILGFWFSALVPGALTLVFYGLAGAIGHRQALIHSIETANGGLVNLIWLSIYAVGTILTLLFLAYRNFKHAGLPLNRAVRQGVMVVVGLVLSFWILASVVEPFVGAYLKWSEAKEARIQREFAVQLGLPVAQRYAVEGVVPLEVTSKLGLNTPLSPEELVQDVVEREGLPGIQTLDARLSRPIVAQESTPTGQTLHRMDPALLRRYGLLNAQSPSATGKVTLRRSATSTNPVQTMDPVLMKRYGLTPTPSK